jgi:hypothetical protein
MSREISNSDDIIDSRDVIKRIEELEDERQDLVDALEGVGEDAEAKEAATEALDEWDDDNGDELKSLKALAEEGENCGGDWAYGATLIRETYFVEYCIQMVQDIGDLPKDIPGYLEIDWDKTADNLRQDYSEVDYDGETYLIRS